MNTQEIHNKITLLVEVHFLRVGHWICSGISESGLKEKMPKV